MAISNQIRGAESGGNFYARNPRSSAFGPDQFIKSTWLDMLSRYRPDLARLPKEQQLALRSDPDLSGFMTDAYAAENNQKLAGAGFDVTPGNTYLAHFAGPEGALKVLRSDPNASAASILGQGAVTANPFLANMTAGQLRAWANSKMGAPIPPASIPNAQPQAQQFPPMAMASAAPNLPLFSPQSEPQPTGQQAPQSIFSLFAPPTSQADLTNWWSRLNPQG